VVDAGRRVLLLKEHIAVPIPGGGQLSLVRKRPLETTRGAVILLHGFGQTRYAWHLSQRSFSAYLAWRGYDVFNLELRGHGRSRALGSPLPRRFEEHVEYDVAAAAQAIAARGHRRFFLLGHSMGGALAYASAPLLGSRVRGVVTLSGVFNWGQGALFIRAATPLLHAALRVHQRVAHGGGPALRADLVGKMVALSQWGLESGLIPVPGGAWVRGGIEPEILREWLFRSLDRTSGAVLGLMGSWAATGRFCDTDGLNDYADAWARFPVPCFVIGADRDQLADAERDVRPAYESAASSDRTFRVFGGAQEGCSFGHVDLVIGRRAPQTVWPAIASWLDAH